MSEWRRLSVFALAGVLALSLAGCGGDSPTTPVTPPPTPPPPPPAPSVVSQGVGLSLEAETLGRLVFTTIASGTLRATVDWTFSESDIDVGLFGGECSFEQFLAGQCPMIAISASTTAKPEVITGSAPVGTYTLFIENTTPRDETVSYQVVLTPSASASASKGSRPAAAWPRKVQPRGFVELP